MMCSPGFPRGEIGGLELKDILSNLRSQSVNCRSRLQFFHIENICNAQGGMLCEQAWYFNFKPSGLTLR